MQGRWFQQGYFSNGTIKTSHRNLLELPERRHRSALSTSLPVWRIRINHFPNWQQTKDKESNLLYYLSIVERRSRIMPFPRRFVPSTGISAKTFPIILVKMLTNKNHSGKKKFFFNFLIKRKEKEKHSWKWVLFNNLISLTITRLLGSIFLSVP